MPLPITFSTRLALLAALSAPVLAACGSAGTPTAPDATPEPAVVCTPGPLPSGLVPGPGGQPGNGQNAGAAEVIQRGMTAFAAIPNYQAKMSFFQKQGSKTVTGAYDIKGAAPRTLRVEIIQGNNTGTKLLWNGGSTVRVRAGGLLGAISLTLSTSDSKVISVRGYTLAETDIKALFGYMTDPQNRTSVMNQGPQGTTVLVEGPKLLKGCLRMRTTFDAATNLPKTVEMDDARECVFRISLNDLRRRPDGALDL